MEVVTSDAHQGLKNAIAAVFARCQLAVLPHPLRGQPAHPNAQPGVPNLAWPPWYAPSTSNCLPPEVHGQLDRVVEQLREPFAQVAELLADAAPDILAFTAFPVAHWQKLWSNNPQERLNREIRRRTDVVGIFPQPAGRTAAGGRGAGRAARRVGRSPPLPHHPQCRRQRGTAGAQYAGSSGLININEDDALLHYLTGHYLADSLGSPAHAGIDPVRRVIRTAVRRFPRTRGDTHCLKSNVTELRSHKVLSWQIPTMNREIGGHRRQENPPQRIGRSNLRVRRACVRPLLIPHLVRQRVIT